MSELEICRPVSEIPELLKDSVSSPRADETRQWFALSVRPRFDKAAASALEFKGYETFLPLYKKRHVYDGRCRDFDLPLFPGYVFCRFNYHVRLPILMTPGVTQILGNGSTPVPVPDSEIVSLRTAIQASIPVQPFPFPQTGQRVRIERGALAGIEGIIVSVKQQLRLVLSITLLQRSVLLEIDHDVVSASPLASSEFSFEIDRSQSSPS